MVKKRPFLSVVIPCFNEEKNLERGVLNQVEKYLKSKPFASEVIISDDESTDNSLKLVTKFARGKPRYKVVENKHGGKPFAVRSGINQARGRIVLVTDMDQSTPIDQFDKLNPYFKKGCQVVIGSRGRGRSGFSIFRRIASAVFILFRKFLMLRNISDTQCGFKAFENKVVKDLFSRLLIFKDVEEAKGWTVGAFDVELLFIADKLGYKIAEVPVKWRDEDLSVTKNRGKKFIKESREMATEILRVKLNDLKGLYGIEHEN